ncbi:uncharacterized protein LOC119406291 [Rhipicephalus sanguineus]|uniref:uncharacterized protein LOC119406291 n=1 Tax=Rhipicephalus sanguineus TaxID=34632 RepID=UPI0018937D1D|nr:uncharacterized protein LOC119406291 [Rhipicephalus sanguineus]
MTDGWKYTLTGFGEFFEMRRVAFAEPMPATLLCGVCGVLSSRTSQLPCGHVLCESCEAQLPSEKDRCCPFDGKKFAAYDVRRLSIKRRELEQRRIVCVAGSEVCGFSGKLSELAGHLTQCGGGEVKCCKCQRPVSRNLALDHYRSCARGTLCASIDEADEAASKEGVPKMADVETSKRKLVPSKGVDLEAVVTGCCSNALVGRVARLERQLLEVKKNSRSRKQPSVAAAKKETVIQGPHRAASKPGVLITTCKFADIYAGLDLLNEKKTNVTISTDAYLLGGYTFGLECEFSKDEDEINVVFALFLRDGEWDSYVQWPFKKKVTLIVMHPKDADEDVRLPLKIDGKSVVKKPRGGAWNWGNSTITMDWNYIELHGYVDRDALYVNTPDERSPNAPIRLSVLEGEPTSLPCPIATVIREPMAAVWFHVATHAYQEYGGSPYYTNGHLQAKRVYAIEGPDWSSPTAAAGVTTGLVDGTHWKQPSWSGRAFFSLLSDPPALRLNRLERSDSGSYVCNVTYRDNVTSAAIVETESRVDLFVAGAKQVINNSGKKIASTICEELAWGTMMKDDVVQEEIGDIRGTAGRDGEVLHGSNFIRIRAYARGVDKMAQHG